MAKIIGVEIKAQTYDGQRAELAMFGCQVPVPSGIDVGFEITLHTTEGDITLRQMGGNDSPRRFNFDERHLGGNALQDAANILHP